MTADDHDRALVKRALVTGAGQRVGRAMALDLAAPGLGRGGSLCNGSAEAAAQTVEPTVARARRHVPWRCRRGSGR